MSVALSELLSVADAVIDASNVPPQILSKYKSIRRELLARHQQQVEENERHNDQQSVQSRAALQSRIEQLENEIISLKTSHEQQIQELSTVQSQNYQLVCAANSLTICSSSRSRN